VFAGYVLILTNFVTELGAVVDEELEGGIAIGTVLDDIVLDLASVGAADSLRISRIGLVARCCQFRTGQGIPLLPTYPMILRTQAGVCAAITTLARATTATAKMDLLKSMMNWDGKFGNLEIG
jgi:hypothetical protein